MPELPEVETTRRGVAPRVVGRRIAALRVYDRRLRWPVPSGLARLLQGRTIERVDRRSKYLLFAIGDGTAGTHKHGGLAAQQADAVAREIARRSGVVVADAPYRPALRAVVRTGRGPRYLRAAPPGGEGDCAVSDECLWWPPSKVVAPWLVPWLAAFDPTDRPATSSA